MLLEAAATKPSSKLKGPPIPEKPIRAHNTEIRRGVGRPVIQTDLHYNVSPSLLKHCLMVIQSVQAPSARTFPKPGNGGQFQSSGREINEEWAFTHMEVMAGQNVEMIGSRLATQTLHTIGLEPQSPRALRTKKGLHWQMQFPQQLNHLNLTCKLNAYWIHSKSIPNPIPNPIQKPIPKLQKREKTQDILRFIDATIKRKRILFLSKNQGIARYPVFSHVFEVSE